MADRRQYHPEKDVYEAARERIAWTFREFDHITLSFSGGKDSGVMLNLVLEHMREHGITRKIGVMIMDVEANYQDSLDFMLSILDRNLDLLDVYWCCLPVTLACSISAFQQDWRCWDPEQEECWIRPIPDRAYVVTLANHPFDFFQEGMKGGPFREQFGPWYAKGGRAATFIGIRAQESLNRYRAIMREKETWKGKAWTRKALDRVYNVYPIYDWRNEDIWTANGKFDWDYNRMYDVFHMAGVPLSQMRVASPFMNEAKTTLGLYRAIDPKAWAKLCARVEGANFTATYGKQLNHDGLQLPPDHTWESFAGFLLDTLPEALA